jgi:hydroxymethylbilane synthase
VIRLGTRASALALVQAGMVAEALRAGGSEVQIVPMRTEGDRLLDARLAEVGGKGLFVRELEQALLDERIDVAVHSLKDLPAEVPDGLDLVAFPERADPRDVLIARAGGGVQGLPAGALIGTSSLRRRATLLAVRPDLTFVAVRGNVDTRLRKLQDGICDALVLAAAGLARLGRMPAQAALLPADVFVPAVGQGILGIEARTDDRRTRRLAAALDHPETHQCATAERAYLRRLGASCNTPMAAHAVIEHGASGRRLAMTALVASEDGRQILRADAAGDPADADGLGRRLAELLLAQGAEAVTTLNPGRWPA